MASSDKPSHSSPVSSSRSSTDASSTIARSGSPPRSTFKATKKNKAEHKNVSNEGKKDNDGRHVAVMASDLSYIGSQVDELGNWVHRLTRQGLSS